MAVEGDAAIVSLEGAEADLAVEPMSAKDAPDTDEKIESRNLWRRRAIIEELVNGINQTIEVRRLA